MLNKGGSLVEYQLDEKQATGFDATQDVAMLES